MIKEGGNYMSVFERVKKYYDKGIYDKDHLIALVQAGKLTTDEYNMIAGESFPGDVSLEKELTDIEILQKETRTLKAQVQALSESNMFLEECLVEMAEIVYA
jgi:hypothetical protein